AVHLKRDGASYKADVEKFCTGSPMNITDCAVAPDGSVYFTLGGRGSQGGVFRLSHPEGASRVSTRKPLEYPDNDFTKPKEYAQWLAEVFQNRPQPLAAWSRAAYTKAYRDFQGQPLMLDREIVKLRSASASKQSRLQLLSLLNMAAQRSETLRFDSLMPLT